MGKLAKETLYDSYIEAWKRRRAKEEKELHLKKDKEDSLVFGQEIQGKEGYSVWLCS